MTQTERRCGAEKTDRQRHTSRVNGHVAKGKSIEKRRKKTIKALIKRKGAADCDVGGEQASRAVATVSSFLSSFLPFLARAYRALVDSHTGLQAEAGGGRDRRHSSHFDSVQDQTSSQMPKG